MGVLCHLKISNRFEIQNIVDVLENCFDFGKVKVENNTETSPNYFSLWFGHEDKENPKRFSYHINLHINYFSPLGSCTLLSTYSDEKRINLFRSLAKIFGGFLEENDCNGNIEEFYGVFSESDGLSYFFKYAILHNELESENDMAGLNKSIHKWFDKNRVNNKEKMNLFPIKE